MKPIYYRDHMIVPADNRISVMVPHAKAFVNPDTQQPMMLIPHKLDEAQVLRNLGYEVTPPVMMAYDWNNGTPFDAQRITTAMITSNSRSFVLNGLGTGKTRSVLYAQDFMKKHVAGHGSLLVTAPLSTLRQTWAKEITLNFPGMTYAVLHGDRAKRIKALEKGADVFIINHDGVEVIADALAAHLPLLSFCALDELSVYKNAQTNMWKVTNKLVQRIPRLTGLTATPMTKDSTDAYGQIKMIAPQMLRGDSFTRFREKMQTKVNNFRWIDKRNSLEDVFALMQPGVRFTRDECYDIPPCQVIDIECDLTKEQEAVFDEIVRENACERLNIVAVNGADRGNKVKQIVTGAVYDKDRNIVNLPCKPRTDELLRGIQQSEGKVIVFVPYKHSAANVLREVRAAGYTAEEVNGDVSPSARERIFTMFMQSPDPRVLVAHPTCMSHGLTLTEASTIIWYGLPDSLETYEQANGRITRAGQRLKQLVLRLVSTKAEKRVYATLDRRADIQQDLLDMFESQDLGALK